MLPVLTSQRYKLPYKTLLLNKLMFLRVPSERFMQVLSQYFENSKNT